MRRGIENRIGVKRSTNELEELRAKVDSVSVEMFGVVSSELNDILAKDEAFWLQRAKCFWYREGDRSVF